MILCWSLRSYLLMFTDKCNNICSKQFGNPNKNVFLKRQWFCSSTADSWRDPMSKRVQWTGIFIWVTFSAYFLPVSYFFLILWHLRPLFFTLITMILLLNNNSMQKALQNHEGQLESSKFSIAIETDLLFCFFF